MFNKSCLQEKPQSLIRGLSNVAASDSILYCFPFAGGGANIFSNWQSFFTDLKVCALQLPGRENRIKENPYLNMDHLADDIVESILPCTNNFYLFGHSMGSKIAYEVERRLESKGRVARLLIISGGRLPHIPEPHPIYNLSDEEFKKGLVRFNGMPSQILENEQLLNFFLPIIRADFILDESYCSVDESLLECPIFSMGGNDDEDANYFEIRKWQNCTRIGFAYKMFNGGHFFIKEHEQEVLQAIKEQLQIWK